MVQVTAIYVGGPNDGETEEITVASGDVLGPGEIQLYGFEVWPLESGSPGPMGRYEPGPGGPTVGTIQFVWQGYTPEQRTDRLNDPNLPFRVGQLTGLSRLINRVFYGTPIHPWLMRRVVGRQGLTHQPGGSERAGDQPHADEEGHAGD